VLLLALLEIKTETVLVGLELDALATAQYTSKNVLLVRLHDVRKGESENSDGKAAFNTPFNQYS
jgi:hypothetical protein